MFESLVPLKPSASFNYSIFEKPQESSALFYREPSSASESALTRDRNFSAVSSLIRPIDIEPLVPASINDVSGSLDVSCFYLQCLLEDMVSKVSSICWTEQPDVMHFLCFSFLFEQFRDTYIKLFFPDLNWSTSMYETHLFHLPQPRRIEETIDNRPIFISPDLPINAKAVIIRWLSKYVSKDIDHSRTLLQRVSNQGALSSTQGANDLFMNPCEWRDPTPAESDLVRNTICSSRSHVNLVNELFRQAFLLPLSQSITMRRVISVYKEWVSKTSPGSEVPLFLEYPRNDNDLQDIRVGLPRVIRSFVSNSANIFVLEVPVDKPLILEEQVEMCKRVLNIYRFMVMKLDMDKETWEQLLMVLLKITSIVIPPQIPARKEDTLGGRLAPAFFQTLIVTWIRANLQVFIPLSLWEEFQQTLSKLTEWDELIREWSKTMDTITRVMSRFVYNINLNDLPLDRLNADRKDRRKRGMTRTENDANKSIVVGSPSHSIPDGPSHSTLKVVQSTPETRRRSSTGVGGSARTPAKTPVRTKMRRSMSDTQLVLSVSAKKKLPKLRERQSADDGAVFRHRYGRQNSRSLELLDRTCDTPDMLSEGEMSRSSSPTSGRDSTSLKESPMNLDGVSLNSGASEPSNTTRCVIAGGHYTGWAAESAVILWRRMLGVLGDITSFQNPHAFAQVMECIYKVVDDLTKVKDNLGVSENASSPPPSLVPPIGYFSPWLLKCQQLPPEFKRGKLIALRILCQITLRRHETPLSPDFLCQFYRCIVANLSTRDIDTTAVIMKVSGPRFLCFGLPGVTVLLTPLLDACNFLLSYESSQPIKTQQSVLKPVELDLKHPRFEGLSFLGTVVGMSVYLDIVDRTTETGEAYSDNGADGRYSRDLKERVVGILLRGIRKDLSPHERALTLSCFGIFVYQELATKNKHPRLTDAMNVLLSSSQYQDRLLLRVACEMLHLQIDHIVYLLDDHPEIPRKIIEGLSRSLLVFVNQGRHDSSLKEIVLTLIMCLGEWCMSVPQEFLKTLQIDGSPSLLSIVMKTLTSLVSDQDILSMQEVNDFSVSSASSITLRNQQRGSNNVHFSQDEPEDIVSIKLAAKMLLGYLVNHLGHFPRPNLRASRLNTTINEGDDNPLVAKNLDSTTEEMSMEVLQAPNTLFFVVNDASVVSFTEIYCRENVEKNRTEEESVMPETKVRVIVRDLIGKFAWDCTPITEIDCKPKVLLRASSGQKNLVGRTSYDYDDTEDTDIHVNDRSNILDSLLNYCVDEVPDCSRRRGGQVNSSPLSPQGAQAEENMIALLLNQHYQEMNYMEQRSEGRDTFKSDGHRFKRTTSHSGSKQSTRESELSFFWKCRRLIDQMGFLSWEKRTRVDLLLKNDKVLREIRNLDNQKCRETHKIAVIYVGEGQEDKNSILLNTSGSRAFESFVSGLGWEVDLETHIGFRGGLQTNKSTGSTAPYFCTSLMEVMFHVSTRIPASLDETESLTKKLRHLGNDEIHIIWSEHWRDYRRGIIPTAFGDVLIIIYPIPGIENYYRIQIDRKTEVQFSGPLYNGAVVHSSLLAGLVRSTAINASRAQRLNVPYYQNFFEERSRCIQSIVQNKESKSFEDYATFVYCPSLLSSPLGTLPSSSSATSRPVSSGPSTTVVSTESPETEAASATPSPKTRMKPHPLAMHVTSASTTGKSELVRSRPLSSFLPSSSTSYS